MQTRSHLINQYCLKQSTKHSELCSKSSQKRCKIDKRLHIVLLSICFTDEYAGEKQRPRVPVLKRKPTNTKKWTIDKRKMNCCWTDEQNHLKIIIASAIFDTLSRVSNTKWKPNPCWGRGGQSCLRNCQKLPSTAIGSLLARDVPFCLHGKVSCSISLTVADFLLKTGANQVFTQKSSDTFEDLWGPFWRTCPAFC